MAVHYTLCVVEGIGALLYWKYSSRRLKEERGQEIVSIYYKIKIIRGL